MSTTTDTTPAALTTITFVAFVSRHLFFEDEKAPADVRYSVDIYECDAALDGYDLVDEADLGGLDYDATYEEMVAAAVAECASLGYEVIGARVFDDFDESTGEAEPSLVVKL